MPYRSAEDPALVAFPLKGSRVYPVIVALSVPVGVFGAWVLATGVPMSLGAGELLHRAPTLLMALVLLALPAILWKSGEPYLVGGKAPALRLYGDRVEVPAARGSGVLRFPLDKLVVNRSTTVVRHVTGIPLSQSTFLVLQAPGIVRHLATRMFESASEAERALEAIRSMQTTGSPVPAARTDTRTAEEVDAEYHALLQAEIDRDR
jgi:hypothetical protein